MKEAGYGRVVLVSSRAVPGVTVNLVAPGPIETENFYSVVPRGSPQVERIVYVCGGTSAGTLTL